MIEFNSKMASDIKGMIELKTATHFSGPHIPTGQKHLTGFVKIIFRKKKLLQKVLHSDG